MDQKYCDIGARNIPIIMEDRRGKPAASTQRWFCGDETGVHETRRYAFWSVLAGPVPLIVFRVASGGVMENELSARGDMTLRQIDLLQRFADRIMPATEDEVGLWLRSHPLDATFLVAESSGSPPPQ